MKVLIDKTMGSLYRNDYAIFIYIVFENVYMVKLVRVFGSGLAYGPGRIQGCDTYCVFQEQNSRRKIGLAKEKNGLYYLETPNASKRFTTFFPMSLLSSLNKDAFWFHHFRLGHLSLESWKSCSLLCSKD